MMRPSGSSQAWCWVQDTEKTAKTILWQNINHVVVMGQLKIMLLAATIFIADPNRA